MPWFMEYLMSCASYWLYIIAFYVWIFMYSEEAVDPPKSNKSFQSEIKDSIPNSTEFIRRQLSLINEHSEKMESFRMRCQTAVLLQMRTFIIALILFIFYFLFRQYHETEENEHAWFCILAFVLNSDAGIRDSKVEVLLLEFKILDSRF
ncbi:hypothetical protein GCK72_002475 [Caenorhabditis remanei]|uniref:Uncharacterized protein n=1 Tax=Caenorhabditis remanei TaxID=31234 RepID=A0A6A5HVC6_CAERE|nr:hypothetical protein GCK72_002475 [Caenorhabditis remanei]KAF1770654.1 hypothetical protein GCK72_002475 [Caenorhabditis remanei]